MAMYSGTSHVYCVIRTQIDIRLPLLRGKTTSQWYFPNKKENKNENYGRTKYLQMTYLFY